MKIIKKQSKAFIITTILLLLISSAIITLIISLNKPTEESENSDILKQAMQFYQKQEYKKAELAIKNTNLNQILELPQACELIISIFGFTKNFNKLQEVSQLCINKNKALGLAAEGLAYSMSTKGKTVEAIDILEKLEIKNKDHRFLASLVRLHLKNNNPTKATDIITEMISNTDMWQTWLSFFLKNEILRENEYFIQKVAPLIKNKKNVSEKIKNDLLNLSQKNINK